MFSLFRAENAVKNTENRFRNPTTLILRYFRPEEVAVAPDGLLGPLSPPSKTGIEPKKIGEREIAHSCIFPLPAACFYRISRTSPQGFTDVPAGLPQCHLAPVQRVVPGAKPANSGA